MKKSLWVLVIVAISIYMVPGSATAWQGRMAGMGDPYGLVQDEADMLTHPAMIMDSSGTRFYSHYRFAYTDVMDWDYEWNYSNPFGAGEFDYDFKGSGDESRHEVLLGSTFDLGAGRMGIFFTYEGMNGDYDGQIEPSATGPQPGPDFDLDSDSDDFMLRFVYGLPVNSIDLGFEAGIAYRKDENETKQELPGLVTKNSLTVMTLTPFFDPFSNIYPYMIPNDSDYYDLFAKASVAGEVGSSTEIGLTLHGSSIVSGDNDFTSNGFFLFGPYDVSVDGDVDGWSLGGDLWLRYKVDDALALPFLVRANYREKTYDADGDFLLFAFLPTTLEYEHKEENWDIEAGGGVDILLDDKSKLAAGIYYQYHQNDNDFSSRFDITLLPILISGTDMGEMPDYDENRLTLKIAYEKEISPTIDFRAGLNSFYGWADWRYENLSDGFIFGSLQESVSMDGDLWGIGLTLGSTIEIDPVTIEPFIGAAYEQTDLDGDGSLSIPGVGLAANIEGDSKREQWTYTAGLSLLF